MITTEHYSLGRKGSGKERVEENDGYLWSSKIKSSYRSKILASRGRPAQNRYLVARYQSCLIDQQSRRSLNNTEKLSPYLNSASIRSEYQHQNIVCACTYGSIFACRCCALPAVMHGGPGVVGSMRMRRNDACAHRRDWWPTSRYTEWRTIPCWRRTPPASA